MARYLIFLFLILNITGYGQSPSEKRIRLRKEINTEKVDTLKINLLFKYGETFETENPDSAIYWYYEARKFSEQINWISGRIRFHDYYGILLGMMSRFDESLKQTDTALALTIKYNLRRWQAIEYNQYGTIYQYSNKPEQAAEYYLKAYEIAEEIKDTMILGAVSSNLSGIFIDINRLDKARYFSDISYKLYKIANDTLGVGYALVNLSASDLHEGNPESALKNSLEALKISRQFSDGTLEMFSLNNYADALLQTGLTDSALSVFRQAYSLAVNYSNYQQLFALQGIGRSTLALNQPNTAISYFKRALVLADSIPHAIKQNQLYQQLSLSYESIKDYKNALEFRKLFDASRDSINMILLNRNVSELETRYESEKRLRELADQKLQLSQQRSTSSKRLFLLIGSLLLITALIVVIIQQLKLSSTRVKKLKSDIIVSEYKTREDERNRLAADMHDDLGAGLSTLRMISEMAKNKPDAELRSDMGKISDYSLQLIESMRQMVWTMSYHNDSVDDLLAYIRSYVRQFADDHKLESTLHFKNDIKGTVSGRIRRNLFLVIKELLHNTVKHSDADNINITVIADSRGIYFQLKDNGRGLNSSETSPTGNGLRNIRRRMQEINGTAEFINDQGLSVTVFIPDAVQITEVTQAKLN